MSLRKEQDESEGLPLYQTVRNRLHRDLVMGTWKPGDMLPTEVELAREYGVSLGTARQALLSLVREGRLVRSAGRGTFVARMDSSRSFARFFRFRDGTSGDTPPSIRFLGADVLTTAEPEILAHLGLPKGAPVLRIRRLLISSDVPVCLYRSYLSHQLVAGLEHEDLEADYLYALIEKFKGIHVVRAEELLRAGLASKEESTVLKLAIGDPIIRIERTAFTHRSKVLEWRESIGRSDTFHYKITMP